MPCAMVVRDIGHVSDLLGVSDRLAQVHTQGGDRAARDHHLQTCDRGVADHRRWQARKIDLAGC